MPRKRCKTASCRAIRKRAPRRRRPDTHRKLASLSTKPGPKIAKLQRYIIELKEDLDTVMKLKTLTESGDDNLMPSVQFYRRFTQNAVVAIRKAPVDVDLTLEDVLREALTSGKGAPRNVCNHCTYIGRCTAAMCAKEPDRIVRICSPDAATACRATLCFDAVELQEYLEKWETRRKSDKDPLPNPAIAMGVSSGALLNVNDLLPHLDEHAEQVLRWQVDMWKEVGQLQSEMTLDPVEYGFLRAIVLPSIQKRITKFMDKSFVGRWWRMTPDMIKKALSIPSNMLLYLMDHPWVTWLALWVAKILRFIWCLSIFGVDAEQMVRIKARIRDILSLSYQFPFIESIVNIIGNLLDCFVNGNVLSCLSAPMSITWNITKGASMQLFGLVTDSIAMMEKTTGIGLTKFIDPAFMTVRDGSLLNLMKACWNGTGYTEFVDNITTDMYVQPLYREIRNLYHFSAFHLCLATGLWVLRKMPLAAVFQVFDAVIMFVPALAVQRIALEKAVQALLKKQKQNSTLHDAIMAMISDVAFLQHLSVFYDLISIFGNLLSCGVIALMRRFPGPWSFAAESPAACCTDSILDDLKFVKKHTKSLNQSQRHTEWKPPEGGPRFRTVNQDAT